MLTPLASLLHILYRRIVIYDKSDSLDLYVAVHENQSRIAMSRRSVLTLAPAQPQVPPLHLVLQRPLWL